jgi:hypothetical protein
MPLEITFKTTFEWTKIYFNSTLHIALKHKDLVFFQTWKDYSGTQFVIEFTFTGGTSLVEYDTKEKWTGVISIIEKLLGKDLQNAGPNGS